MIQSPGDSVQLNFDLSRRIAFQKQILYTSSLLDFLQFRKKHIDSLKPLLNNNCTSEMADMFVSTSEKIGNHIN